MTTRRSCSRWVSRSIIGRASPRGGGVLGRSVGSGCGSRRCRGSGTRGSFWGAGRGERRRLSWLPRCYAGDPSVRPFAVIAQNEIGLRDCGDEGDLAENPIWIRVARDIPDEGAIDNERHQAMERGGGDIEGDGV